MSRCNAHHMVLPCFYCQQGMQSFSTTAEHLDAIEFRLQALERRELPIDLVGQECRVEYHPAGLDVTKAVAVIRDYALGDIVMLSASLKALKAKEPDRPLVLVTRPELYGILEGSDYLDAQLSKHSYEHAKFYRTYDLCHAVETECGGKLPVKDYLSKSRPDIFAQLLGVEGGAEEFPVPVDPVALSKMQAIFGRCKGPIIGIAPTCNSPVRTIPPEYVEPLVKQILADHGGTVVLVGKTTSWSKKLADLKMPNVINLIDTLEVKELIAACSEMDAMISPDTGTMHVAGALGVTCLAVMGNNNPKNFAGFYPTVRVMQPDKKELPCVPCNDRSIPCTPLPKGKYGAECMRLMTPEKIAAAFKKFFRFKRIAYLHDTSLTYIGGAEITTKQMIRAGRDLGYSIRVFDRDTPIEKFYTLHGYDLIILSNMWRFTDEAMKIIMQAIQHVPYVKYEHDHDGLGNKALGKWPRADYAEKIYGDSILNVFVSPAHRDDYYQTFGHDIGGLCIPELIDTEMFRPVAGVTRKPKSILIPVPGKWDRSVLDTYLKDNQDYEILMLNEKVPHAQMPMVYSQFEVMAHSPQRKWPCDRVIYEAALCGCVVVAGDIVEAMSWEKDLTDTEGLKTWLKKVPQQFWTEIGKLLGVNDG